MSSRKDGEWQGESSFRKRPQSLNQRNSHVLQTLANLRAQRLSQQAASAAINPADSEPGHMRNNAKVGDKVKIEGRRRLCKVSCDDDEDSSIGENTYTDESVTIHVKKEGASRDSDGVKCEQNDEEERCDTLSSVNGSKMGPSLDEINSKLNSLNIEGTMVGKSKEEVITRGECVGKRKPRILDAFNLLKDDPSSEYIDESRSESDDESYASDVFGDERNGVIEARSFIEDYTQEIIANKTLDSPEAPEFGSAMSTLSSDQCDDEVQTFHQSNMTTPAGDTENQISNSSLLETHLGNKKSSFSDTSRFKTLKSDKNLDLSKLSLGATISPSADDDDLCYSEDTRLSSYSIESVKSLSQHLKSELLHERVDGLSVKAAADECSDESKGYLMLSCVNQLYRLPSKVAKYLYPHQVECIRWMWNLHCKSKGGILGDDMGLGKTMQASAFLAGLFASRLIKRALIVAPKTVLPNWMKELSIVGLAGKTRDFTGNAGSARDYALHYVLQAGGILLTTYDVVRNNWKAIRGDNHRLYDYDDTNEASATWNYIILDEGHIIKNPSTQRAKSLREIPSEHRIILSGTPIQNNLKEMWALFDFCCPGLLGDHRDFKARYENLILQANDKKATQRQKWVGGKAAEELRERIQPYFLRRLKSEIFPESAASSSRKLAKKDDIIVWLKLTNYQRKLYQAFLQSKTARSSIDGSALAALTVLKKICDHPGLLTERATEDIAEGMESLISGTNVSSIDEMRAEVDAVEEVAASLASVQDYQLGDKSQNTISCKIVFVMALLRYLIEESHRVLVFAQTRKMLNIIQEEIKQKGYNFYRIDGTTKACDREKLVNEFQQSDEVPIFLLTSQVGGLGITLTGADRVIIVDPAWNPSTDNQSVDRAYRIGQLRNVLVYRLITCGTIEEKIYRKQVFKGGLFRTATECKQQTRYFTRQELHELFSVPDSGFDVSLTQQQLHDEHDKQHEIDDCLKQHIEFLEGLGIAGVNHHNLLYSKTETVQPPPPDDYDVLHWEGRKYVGAFPVFAPSKVTKDVVLNGSNNALKPKEFALFQHVAVHPSNEFRKQETIANMKRLTRMLDNKDMISRLPDKGQNLERRLRDLTNQLENIQQASLKSDEDSSVEKKPVSINLDADDDHISYSSFDGMDSRPKQKRAQESPFDSSDDIDVDDISRNLGRLDV